MKKVDRRDPENQSETPFSARVEKMLAARPGAVPGLRHHMVLDGETKRPMVEISSKDHPDHIEVMVLTDLQYGSEGFQQDKFLRYRDWIMNRPHCYVVLGGDLIDAATPLSVGNPYENLFEPSKQVMGLVSMLQPLRDRIIGFVAGNHERRTVRTFGNAGVLIATLLGIPYSRGVQLIDLYYGKHQPFKISLWHGAGSAKTKGAKAQMLHRFMQQADSDVYLCGHLHDVVLLFDWRQRRAGKNRIVLDKIAGVMSSSFQMYWNSYAEEAGLAPSGTMMARVEINIDGRWAVELR